MSIMTTYTGKRIDPLFLKVEDICDEDIAHALSLLCRGGGHLKYFYSVGQHCIYCANEAKARGYSQRVILACLLHDASEAYISDIITPVKQHLDYYLEVENKIMDIIYKAYGLNSLTKAENELWKLIDKDMLDNELNAMMRGYESHTPISLASKPHFKETNYIDVEKEFLKILKEFKK